MTSATKLIISLIAVLCFGVRAVWATPDRVRLESLELTPHAAEKLVSVAIAT